MAGYNPQRLKIGNLNTARINAIRDKVNAVLCYCEDGESVTIASDTVSAHDITLEDLAIISQALLRYATDAEKFTGG